MPRGRSIIRMTGDSEGNIHFQLPRTVNRRNLGRTRLVIAPPEDQASYQKVAGAGTDHTVMDLVDKHGNVYGTFIRRRSPIIGQPASFHDTSEWGRSSAGSYHPTGDGRVLIRLPKDEYDYIRSVPYEGSPVQWARGIAEKNLFEPQP